MLAYWSMLQLLMLSTCLTFHCPMHKFGGTKSVIAGTRYNLNFQAVDHPHLKSDLLLFCALGSGMSGRWRAQLLMLSTCLTFHCPMHKNRRVVDQTSNEQNRQLDNSGYTCYDTFGATKLKLRDCNWISRENQSVHQALSSSHTHQPRLQCKCWH